ncbi:mucin-associated surface protein [Burkholderia sp. Ac-20345]|uniref:DNA-binding protein n=1 Tax=Burkholderia sp. Ac-20345 TaxID=2703891 RepID=UPI00197C37B0|nr:DNA-binding protein [Burkholderia sp. Ac-20345]MBN3783265.1 mucin-associated surface protein [Burkholderia sp. Ac-20345]
MAREPNITQEQVSKVAKQITDEGGRPTARAIREQLGTGSMATVLKFFQAWQNAQVRPAEAPVALPQSLQRGLLEFVAAEVERSKAELQADLEIANQANADLILESERQAAIVENLTATLESAYAEKAELSGRLAQVEAERDEARNEAAAERAAAESARTDLAKALLRLEAMPRLEEDLKAVRDALEKERAARVKAEQEAAVAAAKSEAAREAQHVLERTLEEARQHGREREAELVEVRADLKDARATTDLLRSEQRASLSRPRARASLNAPRVDKKSTEGKK